MRLIQIAACSTFIAASLALTGCTGGFSSADFPDTPAEIAPGAIHGSNFGGHAPIAGAHLFVLQAQDVSNGYGDQAKSLLTSSDPGVTRDLTGSAATNPTYQMYYLTTGSDGTFNITGDYTCTVGHPVYLYAQGGSPSYPSSSNVFATGSFVVSNYDHSSGNATYTFTTTTTELFYVGEQVVLSGYTGTYAFLNGAQTVASTPTTTTFVVDLSGTTIGNGTYNAPGAVTAEPTVNPQIVNLAMLGLCPGTTGEFANTIGYVYMNEVSTAAMAIAMAPFATSATTGTVQNATQIGSTGANLQGMQNAALNAGQLYDIQGGEEDSGSEGEGHIARLTTPGGNGTVPQATLDTLGNILAACVDSQNTYNPYLATPTGTQSTQCGQLFANATTTGGASGGTVPLDTATAAFNIADFPAGAPANTATFMQQLYALQGTTYPFAPQLTSQPNDFTITISYTGGGLGHSGGQSPHAVAVDGSGNVYTLNYVANSPGVLCIFSPLGVPFSATGFSGNGLEGPASVAIDINSNYVWVPNYPTGTVSRFTTAGAAAGSYSTGQTNLQDAEIDGAGKIWITTNNTNALVEMNASGKVLSTATTGLISPFSLAIEPGTAGNIWVADETATEASLYTNTGVALAGSPYTAGGIKDPTGNAIDASGNAWFANSDGTVSALTSTGAAITGSPFPTGATTYSDGIAIDGLGNVWVSNSLGETIYELTNAGVALSPPAGYTTKPATEADGIAIDGSGDLWYDSFDSAVLNEVVGVAAPVVTPLSYAVKASTLGSRP